jgi:hypothetical protein
LERLAEEARELYVMMNNNGRSSDPNAPKGWVSQAPTNAFMLRQILQDQGAPV